MKPRPSSVPRPSVGFDAEAYLRSTDSSHRVAKYRRNQVVFAQGERALHVLYVQKGAIKLSVISRGGKERVVAMLGPGDFFGEGVLSGQSVRVGSATATAATRVLAIDRAAMTRLLESESAFSDRFIVHLLARHARIEADLVDHLFNSSEKRLARALLLLARYGQPDAPRRLARISQETLAEMIGATRGRVNFFMRKFKRLGFVEDDGGLKINSSLLNVLLLD